MYWLKKFNCTNTNLYINGRVYVHYVYGPNFIMVFIKFINGVLRIRLKQKPHLFLAIYDVDIYNKLNPNLIETYKLATEIHNGKICRLAYRVNNKKKIKHYTE